MDIKRWHICNDWEIHKSSSFFKLWTLQAVKEFKDVILHPQVFNVTTELLAKDSHIECLMANNLTNRIWLFTNIINEPFIYFTPSFMLLSQKYSSTYNWQFKMTFSFSSPAKFSGFSFFLYPLSSIITKVCYHKQQISLFTIFLFLSFRFKMKTILYIFTFKIQKETFLK